MRVGWFLMVIGCVLFGASRAMGEENASPVLRITERRTIDKVPVKSLEKEYFPAFHYALDVSSDGRAVFLKIPTSFGDRANQGQPYVSLLVEGQNSGWSDVPLQGWSSELPSQADPQILVDSMGDLVVGWKGLKPGKDVYAENAKRILAKRRLSDGTWTENVILTDPEALGIYDFSFISPASSRLEVLWTDGREKHFVLEGSVGYPKVFGRTWDRGELGPVIRITRKKGKYHALWIKARASKRGALFALWDQSVRNGFHQLFMATRQDAEWSQPVQVSKDKFKYPLSSYHSFYFDVVPMPDGSAWVFWGRDDPYRDIVCRKYEKGALGPLIVVASESGDPMAVGSSEGTIGLIYAELNPYSRMSMSERPPSFHKRHVYYKQWEAGRWSQQQEVATDVFLQSGRIAIDGKDRVHLFWQQFIDNEAHLIHAVGETHPGKVDPGQ
jgi:hypothetical protein